MPDVKEVLNLLAKANLKLIQLVHLAVLRSLAVVQIGESGVTRSRFG
jgi:hypothetical protein